MTGRHSAAVHKYFSQAFSPRKLLNLINLIKIYNFIFNMISCDRSYDRIQSYYTVGNQCVARFKKPVHMVTEVIGIGFPFRPISSKIIGNRQPRAYRCIPTKRNIVLVGQLCVFCQGILVELHR